MIDRHNGALSLARPGLPRAVMRGAAGTAWAAILAVAAAAANADADAGQRWVTIPGGAYPIGAEAGRASARPAHSVRLDRFQIQAFEVTNAQLAAFLDTLDVTAARDVPAGELGAGDVAGPDADRLWSGGEQAFIEMDDPDARIGIEAGRFVPEAGYADHPAPESTWLGARAYCRWLGARLPTEVEWEAAARGKGGRRYPWGDAPPTPARAVYGRGRGETDPVGAHPEGATPRGVHDLAGNLAEWTASLYRPYPYAADDGREDQSTAGEWVTRGGDHVFDVAPEQLTGFFRDGFSRDPRHGHRHIGLRCARDAG